MQKLTSLGIPSMLLFFSHSTLAGSACSYDGGPLNCQLSTDIMASQAYAPKNNFYHNGTGETNIYIDEEVSVVNQQIILSAHNISPDEAHEKNYSCPQSQGGATQSITTPSGVCQFTSGEITTQGHWSTKDVSHGYVEVQASMPVASDTSEVNKYTGMWPAIWMMPDNQSPWPTNGEIDIAELRGALMNQAQATLHYNNTPNVSDYNDGTYPDNPKTNIITSGSYASPHYYGVEWSFDNSNPDNNYLTFWYDGQKLTLHALNVKSKKGGYSLLPIFQGGQKDGYYLIINLATGGAFGATSTDTITGNESGQPLQMTIQSIKTYTIS